MTDNIILGGGCFWCTEAVFQKMKGVLKITPGYAGGIISHPSYAEVCSGLTGHAEVIRLEFDSTVISLKDILSIFFQAHDPTSSNRQGNDIGTQYRSVIFYQNQEQEKLAEEMIAALNKAQVYDAVIVTEVTALEQFYPAEKEHYTYYKNNPEAAYCQFVIKPKVEKIKKAFADKLGV